jgi:hypothetical protein
MGLMPQMYGSLALARHAIMVMAAKRQRSCPL